MLETNRSRTSRSQFLFLSTLEILAAQSAGALRALNPDCKTLCCWIVHVRQACIHDLECSLGQTIPQPAGEILQRHGTRQSLHTNSKTMDIDMLLNRTRGGSHRS